MKPTIWVVFGIFEGGRHSIALFLSKKAAAARQSSWNNHEDCLETELFEFGPGLGVELLIK